MTVTGRTGAGVGVGTDLGVEATTIGPIVAPDEVNQSQNAAITQMAVEKGTDSLLDVGEAFSTLEAGRGLPEVDRSTEESCSIIELVRARDVYCRSSTHCCGDASKSNRLVLYLFKGIPKSIGIVGANLLEVGPLKKLAKRKSVLTNN